VGKDEPAEFRIANDVTVQMAFACDDFSTDPFQRVTFHNVAERINSTIFPATTGMLFVVFGFQRSMPGFLMQCRVEILPSQGDPIASQAIADMAFRPDQMSQRAVVGFGGVTWPTAGLYTVRFTSRGKTIASFTIELAAVQPPPPSSQFSPPQ
jgi:hypothetical protein